MKGEPSPLPWSDNGFGMVDSDGKHVKIYGNFSNEQANRLLIIRLTESHASLIAAAKEAAAWIAEGTEQTIAPSVKGTRTLARGVKLVNTLRAAIAAAEEQVQPEVTGGPSFGGRGK